MATDSNLESGKFGKIIKDGTELCHIRNWTFNKTANVKTYFSSSTAGHQKSTCGPKAGTVNFGAYYDPANPIEDSLKIGDQVTLHLYISQTRFYQVPVTIDNMDDEVQIEDGEIPTVAIESQTNGAWTYPDGGVSTI